MYSDVFNWAKTCAEYQKGKDKSHSRSQLKTLPVESTLFQRWNVDFLGLPVSDCIKYLMVVG